MPEQTTEPAVGTAESTQPTPFGYRPALDGLRAVAVLSVLAYHLDFPWLPGGFLGVDIFFVLSGYLITSLLLTEHARSGAIGLARFWARRARRLVPALLVMVAVVALAISRLRPVTEWQARSSDVLWVLLYGANWHQIATSQDYFVRWAGASPLSHMWSIAIEEQFYIAWPFIMAVALRSGPRRWLSSAVLAAAGVSAMLSALVYDAGNSTRAYVGTDTRAQELLVGAALATLLRSSTSWVPGIGHVAAAGLGGALGVLIGIVSLSDASPLYYRGGALLVSVALAAVIWSIEQLPHSRLSRLLSLAPLTWTGRVSYGLYLWHWPAIVLTPTVLVKAFGGTGLAMAENRFSVAAIAVLVTFTATAVSYYAIERPIRHGSVAVALSPRVVIATATVLIGATLAGTLAMLVVPPALAAQVQQAGTACEKNMDSTQVEIPTCVVVDSGEGRPVLAVMGDSVAKSMHPAFATIAKKYSWTLVAAAHNHCTVAPRKLAWGTGWESCMNAIPVIQRQVLAHRPTLVVVSDNWLPVESYDDAGVVRQRNSPEHLADIENRLNGLIPQLTAEGALVVLMRFTPESAAIECADAKFAGAAHCKAPSVTPRFEHYNQVLDRVARRYSSKVRTIDLSDVVCPNGQCTPKVDGVILRFDSLHYSAEGASWLSPRIERKLLESGIQLGI